MNPITLTSINPTPTNIVLPKFGTLIPNRIFVGGITSTTTEEDLRSFFSTFGPIKDVKVIYDRSGQSKGNYGFVTFENQETAEMIIKNEAESLTFKDRKINIGYAVRKQHIIPRQDMNPPLILNNATLPCSLLPIRGQEFPILATGTQTVCPPAIVLPQPTTTATTLQNGLCCGGGGGGAGGGGGLSINSSAANFAFPHNNLASNCLPVTAQATSGTIYAADPRLTNHLGGSMINGGTIVPPGSLLYAHSAVVIPGGTGSHSIEVISPQAAIYLAAAGAGTGSGGAGNGSGPQSQALPPALRCDPIPIGHLNESNSRLLGPTFQSLQTTNSTAINALSQSMTWKDSAPTHGLLANYGYCGNHQRPSIPRATAAPRQEVRPPDCRGISPTVANFFTDARELSPSPSPRAPGQQSTPGDMPSYGSCSSSSGTYCRDFRSAYLAHLLKSDEGQADVTALECADLGSTEYAQAICRRTNSQQDSCRLMGAKGQPQVDPVSYHANHHQHDSSLAVAAVRNATKCKLVMKTKPTVEAAWYPKSAFGNIGSSIENGRIWRDQDPQIKRLEDFIPTQNMQMACERVGLQPPANFSPPSPSSAIIAGTGATSSVSSSASWPIVSGQNRSRAQAVFYRGGQSGSEAANLAVSDLSNQCNGLSLKQQFHHQESEDVVSPPVAELLSQSSNRTGCELFRDLTGGPTAASCWHPGRSYGSTTAAATTVLTSPPPPSASSLPCDTFPPRLAATAASAGLGTDNYFQNPLLFQTHCNTSALSSSGSRCLPERPAPESPSSPSARPEKLTSFLNKKPDDPISSPVASMTASGDTTRRNV